MCIQEFVRYLACEAFRGQPFHKLERVKRAQDAMHSGSDQRNI